MELVKLKRLIVKNLLGEASEQERQELAGWREASEENDRLFLQLSHTTFLKGAIGDENRRVRYREWDKLVRKTIRVRQRTLYVRLSRVAAVAAVLLFVGVLWWQQSDKDTALIALKGIEAGSAKAYISFPDGSVLFLTGDTTLQLTTTNTTLWNRQDTLNFAINNAAAGDPEPEDTTVNIIRIPRGGEYIVRLEDGSLVYLNAESELHVPVAFGKHERKVRLKGEAYFEVKKEEGRVFRVVTDRGDVAVLGTQFAVRAYAEESEVLVTLEEGSVAVSRDASVCRVEPGSQARIDERGEISVAQVEIYPYVAWRFGRIVFVNTRLEEIMTKLERWYDCEILFETPEIKEMRFTMDIMKYQDITEILELMKKIKKVTYTLNDREVVLKLK